MRVRCINNSNWESLLTVGKEYELQNPPSTETKGNIYEHYYVIDNSNRLYGYSKRRFEIVENSESILLELTKEQAEAVACALASIGGSVVDTSRKHTEAVLGKLEGFGVNYEDCVKDHGSLQWDGGSEIVFRHY